MNKTLITLLLLGIIAPCLLFADVIAPELDKAMRENPQGDFWVMVYFCDAITPQQAINQFAIRGDEISVRQQVVGIMQEKTQKQYHWFFELYRKYAKQVTNLQLHPLHQAVSFRSKSDFIFKVATLQVIKHICRYQLELTKPHDFFLARDYYKISGFTVEQIAESGEDQAVTTVGAREIDWSKIDWTKIINILKQVYQFIEENKPVVNTSVDMACAIPEGISNWQTLAGWRSKKGPGFAITYKNLYGITVVKLAFRPDFYYNGNHESKGRYLTCATVILDELDVKWGYTFSADVKIPKEGIVNSGTVENPVASMKVYVHWMVKTIVQHNEQTFTYYLDGNGSCDY